MAKLKNMTSALGSLKDLSRARAEFDDASRVLPDQAIFPPEEIRPQTTDACNLLLRIANPAGGQMPSSQGDTFAVIHVSASSDFAAVLTINPSTQIESGQTFATLADEGGWPVVVAIAEQFLGVRVEHVIELEVSALTKVIDELGTLPVYSRTEFSADQTQFVEGTNNLDSSTAGIFTSANPVDDAGQTRTRNQRAVLRALIHALKSGGITKDPNTGATILSHFASGIHHDVALTTFELGKLANSLRQLQPDDIAVVTVPTNSRRTDVGSVIVDFDPEAMPAVKGALAGNDLPGFFHYLVSLGY